METVRLYGPLSRAEIARETSLTPQTVASIATELEKGGLLKTQGRRKSERGQPPIDLAINPEGGYTLGIQFNNQWLSGVASDLAGEVRADVHMDIKGFSPDQILEKIQTVAVDLTRNGRITKKRLLGLGVVMPGPFDIESHMAHSPGSVESLSTTHLSAVLSSKLKLPVIVENDATAAALGERLYGDAKYLRQYSYVFIGLGLGAGIIVDGLPYHGAWGNAGEFGHLIVEPGGKACYCGNKGCLGQYVALDSALQALASSGINVGFQELESLYEEGNSTLVSWLETAADKLRYGLHALENILDPETILLGGYLPTNMLEALCTRLEELLPSVSQRRDRGQARVLQARAGPDASALGASALPIFQAISPSPRVLFEGDASVHQGRVH